MKRLSHVHITRYSIVTLLFWGLVWGLLQGAASAGPLPLTPVAYLPLVLKPPAPVMRFAVIGDYGLASQTEQDVATLVKSWAPDFIVTVGDNNYYSGAASTIDPNIGQYYHDFIYPYIGAYGAGADINRFFPTLGNHDWDTTTNGLPKPYLDYFSLPGNERYYTFT